MGPGGDRGDQTCGVWGDQAPGIQAESVAGTGINLDQDKSRGVKVN